MLTYPNVTNDISQKISDQEKEIFYTEIYDTLVDAADQGIYEAYYFLALMNLKGLYTKINKKKAMYYLTLAASSNHSLSYYEMYKL